MTGIKCVVDNKGSSYHLQICPNKSKKSTSANVVLIIDISGSMNLETEVTNDDGDKVRHGWSLLDIVKHAASTICRVLDEYDSVSIVTFTDYADCILDWTICSEANKENILKIIHGMNPMNTTNYVAGFIKGFEQFHKKKRNISETYNIYFFTDGCPSHNFNPQDGYVSCIEKLQKKLFDVNTINVNITTIGLGNQLDSSLLSNIAPHGFIHMPDAGSIGPFMCNLIAHTKSIAKYESLALSDSKIVVSPSSALCNIEDCLFPVKVFDNYVEIHIGSINYDLPRNIIIQLMEYEKLELKQDDIVIQKFEKADIFNDFHVIRTEVIKACYAKSISTLKECSAKLSEQHSLSATINKEVIPGLNVYFRSWGKHYLKALPPMLRDERRSNFRDECLQSYFKDVNGSENTLFEVISNDAEQIFATTSPPKPSHLKVETQITRLPDEFMRGGGCWHGECIVHVKLSSNEVIEKKTSDIKKGDMVFNGESYSYVICVVKRVFKFVRLVQIGSLSITQWHPIFYNDKWSFPIHCNYDGLLEGENEVYDLVLSDTHMVVVEDVKCITLGHNYETDILKHEYYGTDKVIEDLKYSSGWDAGLIEM